MENQRRIKPIQVSVDGVEVVKKPRTFSHDIEGAPITGTTAPTHRPRTREQYDYRYYDSGTTTYYMCHYFASEDKWACVALPTTHTPS